ncbi:hypothetical protein [Piscinibacter sakaiensis]|uniref:hypothetical protein n=1 Tax=Piscinibacter sakaiensis TaxID=1547922 RepID=UPI003AAFB8A0
MLPPKSTTPLRTSTMKRVAPLQTRKPVTVSKIVDTNTLIEALRNRVNELEERLAALESVIQVQNDDVVIASSKSVLISAGVNVEISANVRVQTAASLSETNASVSKFSGLVQCTTITADSVIGKSYAPGAGNVW